MKAMRTLVWAVVLLGMGGAAGAATLEMANLVPSDAKAVIETDNAVQLRKMLLESKFWAALEETEGFREWHASQRYAEMHQRLDQFLANLKMSKEEALRTYLGGRSAVVLLPSGEKKPWGVILTETTKDNAKRLIEATGALEAGKHGPVVLYEVQKENRLDRMASVGLDGDAAVFVASGANGDALERVIDAITASAPSLGTEGHFKEAVDKLPAGWRIRAYAAETPPRKTPGAVALYTDGGSRLHVEWRIVSGAGDISMTDPVVLTAPSVLPDTAVAAVASSFHPAAIWNTVKAKAAEQGEAALEKLRRGEMFIRGWFPGQTMNTITAAFGPEAALAILKGNDGAAPSLLGMTKLTDGGLPVARSFKDGLAAKAMLLAVMSESSAQALKLNVREETYNNAQLLIIEAPGLLEKIAGDWAKDIALTVAVTNNWLIIGTAPAGVRATLDTAADGKGSLAASLTAAGEKVPTTPATRWGVVQPASGADILLSMIEKFAGKATVDQVRKLTNLAEVMKLVKRFLWTRVDETTAISGQADIQGID